MMNVEVLTNRSEIRAAFNTIRERLTAKTVTMRRTIGFPGGYVEGIVHWRPAERFWTHFNATSVENRYWCCYGVQDPSSEQRLDIAAEINPPREGFDRRIAGAFVRAPDDRVFLAHSGKIGGGKKGVGKKAFASFHLGATFATVAWPDGKRSEVILIGEVADSKLPQQIQLFVHQVADFKSAASSGSLSKITHSAAKKVFTPEFEGKKKAHVKKVVTSICDHGTVVRVLKDELEAQGISAVNDRARDLYVLGGNGYLKTLFEVKTDTDPLSLYAGVGQLMMNGVGQGKSPHRILVLPKGMSKATRKVLAQLDIGVLEYTWKRKQPMFSNLPRVVPV